MKSLKKAEITSLSSKGQVVLPKSLRDKLSLAPGSKFLVFSDGENILLKPVQEPTLQEFEKLAANAQHWAKIVELSSDDISEAIKTVRKKEKQNKNCN